jgi:hypothetical protein
MIVKDMYVINTAIHTSCCIRGESVRLVNMPGTYLVGERSNILSRLADQSSCGSLIEPRAADSRNMRAVSRFISSDTVHAESTHTTQVLSVQCFTPPDSTRSVSSSYDSSRSWSERGEPLRQQSTCILACLRFCKFGRRHE